MLRDSDAFMTDYISATQPKPSVASTFPPPRDTNIYPQLPSRWPRSITTCRIGGLEVSNNTGYKRGKDGRKGARLEMNLVLVDKCSSNIFKFDDNIGISKDNIKLLHNLVPNINQDKWIIKCLMNIHPLLQDVKWGHDDYQQHRYFKQVRDELIVTLTTPEFKMLFGHNYVTVKKVLLTTVRDMQILAKKGLQSRTQRAKTSVNSFQKFCTYFCKLF